MSVTAMHSQCAESPGVVGGPAVSPIPNSDWQVRSRSADENSPNLRMERPYLRARRRVRQRVDAGEPRNSYSSIPGYSFRSGSNGGLPIPNSMTNGNSMTNSRKQFFAVAAAAQARASALANYRMPGPFPGGPNNPGAAQGRLPFFNDAFFRPPYPFGMVGHKNGDIHPRPPINGFPFPSTGPLPQNRPPFFPRGPYPIQEDFAMRQGQVFNQFQANGNHLFGHNIAGDLRAEMARAAALAASAAMASVQNDSAELEKTIEAESSEFSSDLEEFRRKTLNFDEEIDGEIRNSTPTANDSTNDGLTDLGAISEEPIKLDNENMLLQEGEKKREVETEVLSGRHKETTSQLAKENTVEESEGERGAHTESGCPQLPSGRGEDEGRSVSPPQVVELEDKKAFAELPSNNLDVQNLEEISSEKTFEKFDIANNNNNNNHEQLKSFDPSRQGVFLRELLHGKLALAAAAVAHRQRGPLIGTERFGPPFAGPHIPQAPFPGAQYPPPFCSFPGPLPPRHFIYGGPLRSLPLTGPHRHPMMEPTLLAKSGDYAAARHNNNELKDAAVFMSQLFKMRQEMALNMTMDGHSSASEREDAELMMDDDSANKNNNEDDDLEEEEELEEAPMDLQKAPRRRTSTDDDGRHSSQSDVDLVGSEPRSPSSDAGLSVSSSGKDASTKSARLEHIVNSMRSSPHPGQTNNTGPIVNGCKKRKLYQPIQHESRALNHPAPDSNMKEESEETDFKKKKNDENTDPDLDLRSAATILRREKLSATDFTNPLLHGPPPPTANLAPALQAHCMEMARRFLQEQQDKITKDAITKEILNDTINKNTDIADRIAAISPELKGLADVLKTEIAASLTVIIDSIVGKYLHARRQNQQHQQQQQRLHMPFGKPFQLGDELLSNSRDNLPPPPALKQQGHTPSGRAPQVRDRSTPRVPGSAPLSMANPMMAAKVTTSLASSTSTSPFPLPPALRAAPNAVDMRERNLSDRASPYGISSPSPIARSNPDDDLEEGLPTGEQDEALSLVVTPKKRRHKVTDTRITPRTMSRVLGGESPVDLHKPFGAPNGFFGLGKPSDLLQARTVPGLNAPHPALFPGLAPPHSFLPPIQNPSFADLAAFTSSFYSPPNPTVTSSAPTTTNTPPVRDSGRKSLASPLSPEKRQRHRSSGGSDSPLSHGSLLSRNTSVDFAAQLREERNKEAEEFAQSSLPYLSGYNMNEASSATLTPMHLRKAKLMFFWVRYPSSAILKMYFPDIKFNKNNTAQLVKWFSNFREFYYIQMEKYARQAISEGVKSDSEIHVSEESELYRVLNVHYNRNNHIEVPEHFLPVLNVTLREFFNSVQSGKDAESSWKKQIYKVIARYDESIPEYFKTPEFLKQLE